ncbi:PD-(D/E)XK nuclease family protein [Lentisphaera profundi]|uniref:PD-(D/E)XK nuclease family protein n=1 Tax=Lentisphaera profundi TaxID=1658616 RepID=A0ABY7VP68_9BACT|nr:PD-(D/E)XK nuclease family protein [Lentisphaera profundi]WDE95494.1 PD-(D/E)XK nuclease family protein [Lentisphaera profundi]
MSHFLSDDIYLLKEEHEYKLKSDPNAQFTSCTTFIKQFFSPFNADEVANKLVNNVPKYFGMTVEQLKDEWNAAADHGTQVHEELEEFIINKSEPKELKSIIGKNWLTENIDLEKFELFPEVIIYCKELKLAGTIDLIAQHKKSGTLLLFDWKTNKRINKRSYQGQKGPHTASSNLDDCNFSHYSAQLSLYRYLLEKTYQCKIHRQIILHLSDEQSTVIDCDYLEDNIHKMLSTLEV